MGTSLPATRSNRRNPMRASSWAMTRLTLGCVVCRSLAACVMERVSMTARKVSTWRKFSMGHINFAWTMMIIQLVIWGASP
ncbi:Uncharacterised protein [Bordetella pertussis]|nr:Uncharacterised protein [Bordetella pertussis]